MYIIRKGAIVAVVAALALAGCSAPAIAPAPTGAATSAAAKAEQAGGEVDKAALLADVGQASKSIKTSKLSTTTSMSLAGKPVTLRFDGAVDNTDPAKPKVAGTMDMGGGNMKIASDGTNFYMNLPTMGNKWLKMSKDDLEKTGGGPQVQDQGAALAAMEKSVKKAVYVGEEDVNGVKTKHYTLTVDMGKLLAGAGASESATSKDAPYDLWLDANHLTRKFKFAMEASGTAATVEGLVTAYNEPVTITIPDASQITTLPATKG